MKNGFNNLVSILLLCTLSLPITGCSENTKTAHTSDKVILAQKQLETENRKLSAENTTLKKQIKTLIGMDKSCRLEAITRLSGIELTRRCGIYDNNGNGVKNALMVYIRTIDDVGDTIKSFGIVNIELWNLNNAPKKALIGKWKVEPENLKKTWSGTFMTNYFKLEFNLPHLSLRDNSELTVKVRFTDCLTGRVFTSQRALRQ